MPIYEGNTVDEAIAKGFASLGLSKADVTIDVLETGKKGFLGMGKKAAKISMEPVVEEEVAIEEVTTIEGEVEIEEVAAVESPAEATAPEAFVDLSDEEALTALSLYLMNIAKELGAPALVRVERNEGMIFMHLDTDKQGILIGKHGKTLNALQYLAQVFLHRVAEHKLSVVINVGDYREKRQAILQRLAERTAERVKRTGQPVFLDPMPAFERKQIHSVLSQDTAVQTHSEGDEPYRYLVVEPAKKYF